MNTLQKIKKALVLQSDNKKKAGELARFFQAFPGGYGEGDSFLGLTVPDQRAIAKKFYKQLFLEDVALLLQENVHEHRLTAVFVLVLKFEKACTEGDKREVVETYLQNIEGINNWDLVDSSAYKILGPWLMDKEKKMLYDFAESGNLWLQRIAIITTLHFIRNHQFADALKLAEILRNHPHDLIHKAVGWMLREIGNRNYKAEMEFLAKHYRNVPRTMLRYAIEKFDENTRQGFLKGEIK